MSLLVNPAVARFRPKPKILRSYGTNSRNDFRALITRRSSTQEPPTIRRQFGRRDRTPEYGRPPPRCLYVSFEPLPRPRIQVEYALPAKVHCAQAAKPAEGEGLRSPPSGVRWQAQRDTALFAADNERSEAASAVEGCSRGCRGRATLKSAMRGGCGPLWISEYILQLCVDRPLYHRPVSSDRPPPTLRGLRPRGIGLAWRPPP